MTLSHYWRFGSLSLLLENQTKSRLLAQGDDEEAAHYLAQFENTSKALAAANAKFGSDVKVEMAMFDIEAFGLAATDFGDDGKGEPDRL